MNKDITKEGTRDVLRWKRIAIILALVAVLALGLPYMHPQEEHEIGHIVINNETHGVHQIGTFSIESGQLSPVKKYVTIGK